MSNEDPKLFELNKAERKLWIWAVAYFKENDRIPSTREMARRMGIGNGTLSRLLNGMRRKGWFEPAPAGGWRFRRNPPEYIDDVPNGVMNIAGRGIPDDEVVFEVFPDDSKERVIYPNETQIKKVLEKSR